MLGFGNSNITRLLASDISEDMVSLTVRNLALLTRQGLDARERELKEYFGQYQKPSHREALDSLARLRNSLCHDVESLAFTADCTGIIPLAETPDIIITDVPYGNLAMWESSEKDSLREMYLQLSKIAHPHTILAVIMDKGQKYRGGDAWVRLERQMIGKRKFEIYRLR